MEPPNVVVLAVVRPAIVGGLAALLAEGTGVPNNPADFYDICYRAAARYPNTIRHWGMWNVPNLPQFWSGTRQQYIDIILKNGADAIHAGHALGQDGDGLAAQQRAVEGAAAPEVPGRGPGGLVQLGVELAGDQARHQAAWPSTGNFCRGGAFDSALLGCKAIAILPEGMSKERFEWLRAIGTDEIIPTPGTESNVKEIYDKCWELRKERGGAVSIFNQFEVFGNAAWHYTMTGSIVEEVFAQIAKPGSRLAGYISATTGNN